MVQGAEQRRQICVAVDGSYHSSYALDWTLRHVVNFEHDVLYLVAVARRHTEMATVRAARGGAQGRAGREPANEDDGCFDLCPPPCMSGEAIREPPDPCIRQF